LEIIFTILLILHITGGSIGLITGAINMIRRKGDVIHKRVGRFFLYGMLTAGSSAFAMSLLHPNHFLMIVGLFTLYMVGTGYRYIHLSRMEIDNDPKSLDWILTYGMGVAGILFVILGAMEFLKGNIFGIVYLVFAGIGFLFIRMDLNNYKGKSVHKNYWLLAHLQRMIGGYIAALTAFLVVNADLFTKAIPAAVYWLLPTVILTPLIIYWSRVYSIKVKI
jgi:uncharacterized membrane protein